MHGPWPALELHVHRRPGEFPHQRGQHGFAVVERDDEAVAVGQDGLTAGAIDAPGQGAGAEGTISPVTMPWASVVSGESVSMVSGSLRWLVQDCGKTGAMSSSGQSR